MDVDLGGIFSDNDTYDYKDYDGYVNPDDIYQRDKKVWLIPLLYSVELVIGLLGNGLLMAVLAKKRRPLSISDIFVFHLSIADILLLAMLPFWAARAAGSCAWCFHGFFCKISGAIFNMNFYCGIFLLVCISRDRYLYIVHDTQVYFQKRPWFAHITCLVVWISSLILTVPDWIFLIATKNGEVDITSCVHKYSEATSKWQLVLGLIHHLLGFLVPAAALIFYCTRILIHCSCQGIQKQRFILVILPLVAIFLLCWMPYNITFFLNTIRVSSAGGKKGASSNSERSLEPTLRITSALGCAHACLRPLLYLVLCRYFRKGSLATLKGRAVEFTTSLWEFGVGEALPDKVREEEETEQMASADHQVQSSKC